MKIAIMQPYFFPYIGYFQLFKSVDVYVFYDDVNYIKKGWINRNYILLNKKKHLLTVPCKSISQNKPINCIQIDKENKTYKKILKTVAVAYKNKAPYFDYVFPVLKNVMHSNSCTISMLAIESITSVSTYLGIKNKMLVSSRDFSETKNLRNSERIITICKKLGATEFINAIGGMALYDKNYFYEQGIRLSFIKPFENICYAQGNNQQFIPWLSMIDVLMFNSPETVNMMLDRYILT